MTLQKKIGFDQAFAIQGDRASLNPVIYAAYTPLAEEPVSIGTFVWAGTDAEKQVKQSGSGLPVGFVERWHVVPIADLTDEASLIIPAGFAVTVARRGDFWAVSSTAATIGQKVFAVLANGTIKTGAAGATVAGAVETSYVVKTAGDAGDLIMISNWD